MSTPTATTKQTNYIHALNREAGGRKTARYAGQLAVHLPGRLRNKNLDKLDRTDASEIIDLLKAGN